MTITHIFNTGSSALDDYIAKFPIGAKLRSTNVVWTVTDIDVDDSIPPEPISGTPSTKVTVTFTTI